MTPFYFLLSVLAVYRVAHMVAAEEGPWRVFERLRDAAGEGWVGHGVRCVLCMSFWLSVIPALGVAEYGALWHTIGSVMLYTLGIAGGVLTLHKVLYSRLLS